jgi:nitroimidazol reductase NimA-like FMN-containing flavoprotein (pyridoxamine 5'-phosphate oxidase superfamily)
MPYVRRGQLSLTDAEAEEYLRANRWGRLATASLAAEPHVTPLGYVYHRGAIYFHALRRSRRGRHLAENPKVAFLVDDGVAPGDPYSRRRGLIVYGRCAVAEDGPLLDEVRHAYMRAMDASSLGEVQRRTHSWYWIDIDRLASWDFRKIPAGADRKA